MASFLAIQSATVSGLAANPQVASPRLTTGVSARSADIVADSVTVTLSDAARALSVIGNTAIGAATNNDLTPPITASNDAVASAQSAFSARLVLQNLLDDPALRAIKNQADPLYSALIAASHLGDFVPAAFAGVDLSAIGADVPAPVSPVAASRAIDFYRESAEDTKRLRLTA